MIQLEGRNPVQEALNKGVVAQITVEKTKKRDPKLQEIIDQAKRRGVKIEEVTRKRLDKLSTTSHHQGVIAFAQPSADWSLSKVLKETGKDVCILLLDQVQDPQNLGAILRTSEGAGVDGVLVPKKGSAGLTPAVHRVSMGGSLYVPVWQRSLYPAIKEMKKEGLTLIAVDPSGSTPYYSEDLTGPVAFVFGGEDKGVSPTMLEKCDQVVKIPMKGRLKSLNVSVATAVVLYERLRQQEEK